MKALRWHDQKDIRLEEIDEPTVAPGKVKLKVNGAAFAVVIYMNI